MDQEAILWYQLDTRYLANKHSVDYYYSILQKLEDDPSSKVDFIFCPETNTVNIVGTLSDLMGTTQDLEAIGFNLCDTPNEGILDPQQRTEFIDMILNGGSYSG